MDKNAEALDWIEHNKGWIDHYEFPEKYQELFEMLLTRANPIKPNLEVVPLAGIEYHCQVCSHRVYKKWGWNNEYVPKYCSECGQKIEWNWSEE
jgi:hypothetical protein